MGHYNAMFARPLSVDVIVADPETGHEFELGQSRHERRVDLGGMIRGHDNADIGREPSQRRFPVGFQPELVQVDAARQSVADLRHAFGRN